MKIGNSVPYKSPKDGWNSKSNITVSIEKQEENLRKFVEDNEELWKKFCELKDRIPWYNNILSSLENQVKTRGNLTDKQKSLIMSLYIDSMLFTDELVKKQREARKLLIKLEAVRSNRNTLAFIRSVKNNSDRYKLSDKQIEAIYKVAKKYNKQLSEIELVWFDGWFGEAKHPSSFIGSSLDGTNGTC